MPPASSRLPARPALGVCLLLLGCTKNTVTLAEDGSSGEPPATSTSAPEPSGSHTVGDATSDATTDATVSTTAPEPADDTGSVFVPPHDVGVGFECDIFHQDCPAGQKCTFWADDGGSSWNATGCVPLVDDPADIDEPCQVQGGPTSGLDDCGLAAMCWDVDPMTDVGTCVPLCIGSERDPICADPGRYCSISGDSILLLCLPACQPVEQDCPEGQACYPVNDQWSCAHDASGDLGAYGDPCEFINVCDPGLICVDGSLVPPGQPCDASFGCCTEVCDLADPLGDDQCTGAAEGQTCQPWYEPSSAPLGYEDVGVCALPW